MTLAKKPGRRHRSRHKASGPSGQPVTARAPAARRSRHLRLPAAAVQQPRHPWLGLLVILGSAVLLVGGLWVLSSSGAVANRFKPQLESELTRALNRPVTIGRLEGGIFDRVVLRDVKLSPPGADATSLDITIERVVVRYSLWDLLVRKAPLADSLREIQLIRPLLRFEKQPEGKWIGPNLISWAKAPAPGPAAGPALLPGIPPIKIVLYGGELRLTDQKHSASIQNLRGIFNLKDPANARLFLSGRTPRERGQNVKASGYFNLLDGGFHLGVTARQVELRPFERVARPSPFLEVRDGKADMEFTLVTRDSRDGDLLPGVDLQGKLVLEDLSLQTTLLETPLHGLFAVALLDNDRLAIKNLQVLLGKTAWAGQGNIEHLRNPRINFRLHDDRLKLLDLTEAVPAFAQLKTEGTGTAAILVKGQLPEVEVTGTLRMDRGKIANMRIRKFESIVHYARGTLRLLLARGVVARGWVEGKGSIQMPSAENASPQLDFSAEAKNVALEDIGSLFHLSRLSGKIQAALRLQGELERPAVFGEIRSERLRAGDLDLKRFDGTLRYNRDALSLLARADVGSLAGAQLRARLSRTPQAWMVEDLGLFHNGQELAGAWGEITHAAPGHLLGQVRARNLPLAAMPVLSGYLKHLNGTVSLDGRISGSLAQPLFSGRFSSARVLTLAGRTVDASGEIEAVGNVLRLHNISVDRGRIALTGVVVLSSPFFFRGALDLRHAALEVLTALAGYRAPGTVQGLLQGRIEAAGSWRNLQTKGDIRFTGLRFRGVTAETGKLLFTSTGRRLWVKSLELLQPAGKFNASLETDQGGARGPFLFRAWMDNFQLGGRRWTGDIKLDGSHAAREESRYDLRLRGDNLQVDRRALPPLDGNLSFGWEQKLLNLIQVSWGEQMALSGQVRLGGKPQGELQLLLQDTTLEPWRLVFFPHREKTADLFSGLLKLTFAGERARADVHLKAGTGDVSGQVDFDLAERGLRRYSGQARLERFSTRVLLGFLTDQPPPVAAGGTASGSVRWAGNAKQVTQFDGETRLDDFHLGEWRFSTLSLAWKKNGARWELLKLEGVQPDGKLRASEGYLQPQDQGLLQVGANLQADHFHFVNRFFTGHFSVAGTLLPKPHDLQLQVASPDFTLNRNLFGDFRVRLRYRGQDLAIHTSPDRPVQIAAELQLPPGGAVLFKHLDIFDDSQHYISGHGRVDGTGTSDLLVTVKGVGADLIARCLNWPQPWTGVVSGSLHYQDPEKVPHYRMNVKIENGSVLGLGFDAVAGTLLIDHDWLYFLSPEGTAAGNDAGASVLRSEGRYTLWISGKIPLPQTPRSAEAMHGAEMDLNVKMPAGDFSYITFIPYFSKAAGKSSLDLKIRGTLEYPSLNGRVRVQAGTLFSRLYTPRIQDFYADLEFKDNALFIRRLDGKVEDGRLVVRSGSRAPWAAMFRRFEPDDLNLVLESQGGRLRLDTTPDFEFVSAWLKLNATLTGTYHDPVFGGTLELEDGQFTYPPRALSDFSRNLKGGNMRYQALKVVTGKNFWFYNDMVKAQIVPGNSVVFNGGQSDFSAEGRVTFSKGTLTYLDADFTLDPSEESAVVFRGREKPRLQALAQTVIRDVELKDEGRQREATIYMRARGELGQIKVDLYSEPTLTQAQIMSLLTLGEDYSSWSQPELEQKFQSAGARILGKYAGNLLGREIERGLKKIAPVDVVGIRLGGVEKLAGSIVSGAGNTLDAAAGGGEPTGTSLLQNTQIDLGKYLTDDLYLNYRATLKDRGLENGGLAWQSLLGVEYNLSPSRKLKFYKNFDKDSNQEFFWGIEGRSEFKGWSPQDLEGNSGGASATPE